MSKLVLVLVAASLTACALDEGVETGSTDQALTANEIDKTYFSDATFTTEVGESDLFCSGGKRVTGRTSKYFATFTYSCHGGTQSLQCYELAPVGTDLIPITCPEGAYNIIVN